MRVKICGITNLDDALWALECGADALGFVFAPSRRQVNERQAGDIRAKLPPFVSTVGVFVEPVPQVVKGIFECVGLDFIQVYGGQDERFIEESGLDPKRLIKAVSVRTEDDLQVIGDSSAGVILLDTKVEGMAGGTGRTFDWTIAAKARRYGRPIVLSGGLNPENVESAIEVAAPDAVDVSSGVESSPGRKDAAKVREFIRRAKRHAT
ncbi:MAG: phosphoribosylanthranilate isomerase [Candidatus Abyssubacteria bacterium]